MFTAVTVPPDGSVCDVVRIPADSIVRNSPVTAMAITAPIDIFRIAMLFSPVISNAKSQVLINIIVASNYTTTQSKQKENKHQDNLAY